MKILITGCAGFIGSRLTQKLLDDEHRILGIDNLYVGLPKPKLHDNLIFENLDIRDSSVSEKIKNFSPHIAIHLAAVHHIPTCENDPVFAFDVNVLGTQNILKAINDVDKFILISSGAVYAWTTTKLNVKTSNLYPRDIYSISKATNESQVKYWSKQHNNDAIIIRLFNTIGINDPNAHLIPDIINQIDLKKKQNTIQLGNIKSRRDYIYIDDVVDLLFKAAIVKKHNDYIVNTYNVGSGYEYNVKDIVEGIGNVLDMSINIEINEARIRKNDRISQLADITLTKDTFEWSPKHSLQQSLEIIVTDFLK